MSQTNLSAEQARPAEDAPPSGLTWGVKRSFMGYLSALSDAEIALGEGATLVGEGFLNFTLVDSTVDPGTGRGTMHFHGQALLSGHGGMMSVALRDPRLELDGALAVLGVVNGDEAPVPLATLEDCAFERNGTDLLWSSMRVLLTAEGSEMFARQYAAGQELDPVFVRIPLS